MTSGQVYREGAYKGVPMGIYLTLIFLFTVLSEQFSLLSLAGLAMLCYTPFFTYRLIVKIHKKYFCTSDFASLWMLGISIFIGGSMICALCSYAYLQYIDPNFIYRQAVNAAELYKKFDPDNTSGIAEVIDSLIDNNMLPTSIEVAVEMLWTTTFFGSLLSMLLSAIVRKRHPKQ